MSQAIRCPRAFSGMDHVPVAMFNAPLAKVLSLVRERGYGGAIQHVRAVALHKAHMRADKFLPTFAVGDVTETKVELSELTIESINRAAGVHYLPTPWRVLDWLHEALPEPDKSWSFVDLGCGKGRALMAAARRPYGQVIGVEFARELAEMAKTAVSDLPWRIADRIDVVEGDASQYTLPDTPLIIFLFNPFGPPVIDEVARQIATSYRRHPRPIVVAYLNPEHHGAFSGRQPFHRYRLAPKLAFKFATISPYPLHIFATPEAMPYFPAHISFN